VLALALSACSSSGSGSKSSNGKPSGQLIFGESTAFPENLMSLISAGNSTAGANILGRVQDAPFRVSPDIAFIPDPDQGTATSSMVNGQQVVDVKINPKAVWDDGQPITADDYVFTAESQKSADPKKGGCAALLGTTGFDQLESSKAVSKTEAQFTFIKGKPFADWKSLFAGGAAFILSKHVFDKGSPAANCAYITKGWPIAGGLPAGTTNGPWMLLKSNINVASKTLTLTPNPKYWGKQPKLARLVYVNIGSDSDTNIKALQNQEVNMIYPQPQLDLVANAKKLSSVTTAVNFGPTFEHFDMNTKDPLLAHKEVRQAFAYAIDRPALIAATVGKFSDKASVLGNRLIMGTQKGYEDHSGAYAKQDIAKAKSLLEGIGAKMGGDGYYTLNGKQLSFKIITTQNNPLRDQTIATVAAQVKQAGIKVTESPDADIFAGPDKPLSLAAHGFQIALFAWVGTPAISSSNSIYQTGGGQNYSQGSDPAVDAQLAADAVAPDNAAEVAAANAADKALWEDMFTLPLYQKPTFLAYDSSFTGIGDNSTSAGPLWNSDEFAKK
jgi:peptide/nickel transport system substrate-binding protein